MRTTFGMVLFLFLLCARTAAGQNHFTANLTGTQEVPPNASSAIGFARASLNAAGTQLTVSVHFSGLGSNLTAGHIHGAGGPGVNAPVLFNLNPTTGVTQGAVIAASFAISPTQLADLRGGLHYVNLHSSGFPGGEIRGQLLADTPIVAPLDARQEVPPNASTARGSGSVFVNPATSQVMASLSWSGLSGAAIAGHIHAAAAGINGPVICNLAPAASASGSLTDVLCTLTAAQVSELQAGRTYFNLHTASFPGGEIRGQIDGLLIDGFE